MSTYCELLYACMCVYLCGCVLTRSPCASTTPGFGPHLSWTPHGSLASPACPKPPWVAHPRDTPSCSINTSPHTQTHKNTQLSFLRYHKCVMKSTAVGNFSDTFFPWCSKAQLVFFRFNKTMKSYVWDVVHFSCLAHYLQVAYSISSLFFFFFFQKKLNQFTQRMLEIPDSMETGKHIDKDIWGWFAPFSANGARQLFHTYKLFPRIVVFLAPR